MLDDAVLETTLLDLADSVAGRLRRNHLAARGVQLKLRYEGFDTLTRQLILPRATREARPLYDAALRLLRGVRTGGRGVRLIGITAINLTDAEQLTLFDAAADREARLEATVDAVRARFGDASITRARLLARPARATLRLRRAARRTVRPTRGLTNRTAVRMMHVQSNACSHVPTTGEQLTRRRTWRS